MGSRRYLLSKTLQAVVTLWFVLTFNFFLFPILQQYAIYMRQTLTGDLGQSLRTGEQVKDMIGARFFPTVVLVGLGTLLASWFGIVIGIRGGWRRGSTFDTTSQ